MDEYDIVQDRADRSFPYVVALMNLTGDFNKSSAIRNANNFLAQSVVIVGNKKWDRRGAVGAHHYMPVTHAANVVELHEFLHDYTFVAFENTEDATPLKDFTWPLKSVMLFGEEQRGLSPQELLYCDEIVTIPTMGTVRSLNVAVASGIAMYDYCQKSSELL